MHAKLARLPQYKPCKIFVIDCMLSDLQAHTRGRVWCQGCGARGVVPGVWCQGCGAKAKIDPDPGKILACGHLVIPDHRSGISVG